VMLDQFRPVDIDRFYATSRLGPRAKAKMLDRLRGFFRFCVNREWIGKTPVSQDLKPPAGSTRIANKRPFTDQQLARVFTRANITDDRATPHRFRHTFTRILLQRGVSISDVADLTGDDEETTRRHYARWVPERQARLTHILQDAFKDKPRDRPRVRPRLTVIHGGRTQPHPAGAATPPLGPRCGSTPAIQITD
jgi:site-specific recombinase XerD